MTTAYLSGDARANALANMILRWTCPQSGAPANFLAESRIEISTFKRIKQYRLLDQESFRFVLTQLAVSLSNGGLIGVVRQDDEYSLYIGSHDYAGAESASSTLPNSVAIPVGPNAPLFGQFPYGGVIGGIPIESAPDWDAFFRTMPKQSAIVVLIQPASPTLCENILELLSFLRPFQKQNLPFGFNGQKVHEIENPRISAALRVLDQLKERIEKEDSLAVSACFWYAGFTPETAMRCGKQLASCLRAINQPLNETTWCYDDFYIPYGSVGEDLTIQAVRPFSNTFATIRTAAELGVLLPVPQEELPGCMVLKYQRDNADHRLFDVTPHTSREEAGISLGPIIETGIIEQIPLKTFTRHCLIAGSTGSGKTTLLKSMIQQFHQKRIPTLIIESAKEEFNDLPMYGVPVITYSTGATGKPLCFNPLIPELFTTILSHVKSLVKALTVFDDQAPIPQALELCLGALYKKHGWRLDETVVSYEVKSFPTLPELLDFVIPYLQNECPLYRGDARVNVSSALYTRLNQLASYHFLRGTEKLPIDKLLNGTVRVQFDGLQEASDKCFFGLFLLTAFNTALRNGSCCDQLSRVVVIDEAHNLLVKGQDGSLQSVTAGVADSLLSEIRSYGVSVIIADQRPAALTEQAIANTAVKVVFSLSKEDDLNAVTSQLMLSDAQKRQIISLRAGDAIVSVSGMYQTVQIHVDVPQRVGDAGRTMCRFCPYPHICTRGIVDNLAKELPLDAYAQHLNYSLVSGRLHQTTQSMFSSIGGESLTPIEQRCLYGLVVERLPSRQMRNYMCSVYPDS